MSNDLAGVVMISFLVPREGSRIPRKEDTNSTVSSSQLFRASIYLSVCYNLASHHPQVRLQILVYETSVIETPCVSKGRTPF